MRTHQKYFSCAYADGRPAPHFLFVANNLPEDSGSAIVAGNERVLRARLADARFFWDQDRKVPLASRVEALKDRVYHAKLGSVYDKVTRIEQLAIFLAEQLYPMSPAPTLPSPASGGGFGKREAGIGSPSVLQPGANGPSDASMDFRFRGNDGGELGQLAARAARLAKADLSTGMVGEFPELQGVMGQYYALHGHEDARVAAAIGDHYKPQGPNDTCPTAPESVAVALAEKLDTLTAFFAIGEKPTGSRDPFALRRAAQGVIRLILENGLRLNLREIFEEAELCLAARRVEDVLSKDDPREALPPNLVGDLLSFIGDRLKIHLRDKGARHDLVAAIFALQEYDLVRLLARVAPLSEFLASQVGADLLIAYRRASNIVGIETRKGGWTQGDLEAALMRQPEETALADRLVEVQVDAGDALRRDDFPEAMAALARLRQPVDAFFDKVTVNTDEPKLRENRLRLLARIRDTMNQVADFSQIEG
jgi:glycyl-tRNA synthetase beta chain